MADITSVRSSDTEDTQDYEGFKSVTWKVDETLSGFVVHRILMCHSMVVRNFFSNTNIWTENPGNSTRQPVIVTLPWTARILVVMSPLWSPYVLALKCGTTI